MLFLKESGEFKLAFIISSCIVEIFFCSFIKVLLFVKLVELLGTFN